MFIVVVGMLNIEITCYCRIMENLLPPFIRVPVSGNPTKIDVLNEGISVLVSILCVDLVRMLYRNHNQSVIEKLVQQEIIMWLFDFQNKKQKLHSS